MCEGPSPLGTWEGRADRAMENKYFQGMGESSPVGTAGPAELLNWSPETVKNRKRNGTVHIFCKAKLNQHLQKISLLNGIAGFH